MGVSATTKWAINQFMSKTRCLQLNNRNSLSNYGGIAHTLNSLIETPTLMNNVREKGRVK